MTVLALPERDLAGRAVGRVVDRPDGPAERIVGAAVRCVARWGLAKTTLDDVAREAGCGRATVYRLFPGGRDALWDAVVATEATRFFSRIATRAGDEAGLEDVLVAVVTEAAAGLSQHAALRFLLAHEPEAILPHLAFHRMNGVLRVVGALGGPLLTPWLAGEEAARAAEWVARAVISYLTSPSDRIDLADEASARHFVRTFVLPGLQPSVRPAPESEHLSPTV
jgi:AcrR family transcriptional regulator